MTVPVAKVFELAERMQARAEKGFRVSPATAPLIVQALRFFANSQALARKDFTVEKWDHKGLHVEEIVASAGSIVVAHAAFAAAAEQYPAENLTLRNGAHVIKKQERPTG
jgi:hypothetical protein